MAKLPDRRKDRCQDDKSNEADLRSNRICDGSCVEKIVYKGQEGPLGYSKIYWEGKTLNEVSYKNATVVIIEDNGLIAFALKKALAESGFEPIGPISKYSEALNVIGRSEPQFCVLDLNLADEKKSGFGPGEEGRRLLSILNARKIPTVVYSGYVSAQHRLEDFHDNLRVVDKAQSTDSVIRELIDLHGAGNKAL